MLRNLVLTAAGGSLIAGVVYLATEPSADLLHRSPGLTLALGLIGLGLWLDARRRARAPGAARP